MSKRFKLLRKLCPSLLLLIILFGAYHSYRKYFTEIPTGDPHSQLDGVLRNTGFVLTLSYSDQQTAAAMGIVAQQCWLRNFNQSMDIVEPFVNHSYLVHNPEVWALADRHLMQKQLRFSDYFDLENFNHLSGKDQKLEQWEKFLLFGPRDVIVVNINYAIPKRQCLSFKIECPAFPEYPLDTEDVATFWEGCEADQNTQQAIAFLIQKGFRVVREVCLNCAAFKPNCGVPASISAEDVHRRIFHQFDSTKVTVIFNEWYYRFNFRTGCSNVPYNCLSEGLHPFLLPSVALQQKAKRYVQSTFKSKVIAVMIRMEWILAYHHVSLPEVKMCITKALREVEMFRENFSSAKSVLTTDFEKYGTRTFSKTLGNAQLQVLNDMAKYVQGHIRDWSHIELEKEMLHVAEGIQDSGYIAQLERTVASHADCLVLVGGGNFQELTLSYYIEMHKEQKKKCVSIWCAGEKTNIFKKMLQR